MNPRILLVTLVACHGTGDDGGSSSAASTTANTMSATASPTELDPTTVGTTSSSTETTAGTTFSETTQATDGGVCGGPEHSDYQQARCPYPPPDCTPALPLEKWASYCQEIGSGPVGSGDCACTPAGNSCGTPEGPGEYEIICCCPLPYPGP